MRDHDHHECCSSSSSSIDSNYYNYTSSSTSLSLSTDLRLGLTISSSSSTLIDSSGGGGYGSSSSSLLVKVYMEGIAIGRKLDLMTLDGYHSLVVCLSHMFKTPITLYSDENKLGCCRSRRSSDDHHNHVVVYEDKEGDWLLVGDVPWQLFLTSVKRLKITKYVEPC